MLTTTTGLNTGLTEILTASPSSNGAIPSSVKPALTRQSVRQRHQRHVNRSFGKLASVMNLPVEVRSEGCLVYDEMDEAYLDCGGYGVFIMGHRHPRVIAAVKAQLDRHPLSTRSMLSVELVEAAETLISVAPRGMDYAFFANSAGALTWEDQADRHAGRLSWQNLGRAECHRPCPFSRPVSATAAGCRLCDLW